MTHCFNRPDFIELQARSFKKFLKDDYEFVVFNDAQTDSQAADVIKICQRLNITSIRVPQKIHSMPYLPRSGDIGGPSAECADTIQFMYDKLGSRYKGIAVVIDSDMFLIRDFSIETFTENQDIVAHPQLRYGTSQMPITYFLPNLMFFDMRTLPNKKSLNFNLAYIDGTLVDTGGCSYFYLMENPNLKWRQTNCITAPFDERNTNLNSEIIENFKAHPRLFKLMSEMKYDYEFYVDYAFLHYRAGSNWYYKDAQWVAEKTQCFLEAMEEIL